MLLIRKSLFCSLRTCRQSNSDFLAQSEQILLEKSYCTANAWSASHRGGSLLCISGRAWCCATELDSSIWCSLQTLRLPEVESCFTTSNRLDCQMKLCSSVSVNWSHLQWDHPTIRVDLSKWFRQNRHWELIFSWLLAVWSLFDGSSCSEWFRIKSWADWWHHCQSLRKGSSSRSSCH